jgi:AraC family transcriptional regulator
MATEAHLLARGPGWRVSDIRCASGPRERPFEERHESVSLGVVLEGSFQYRNALGSALLAPGAVLLGNPGQCFECGHEHAAGDRCLAVQFDPALWEEIAAAAPGVRRADFALPSLSPSAALAPLLAEAEAARDAGDAAALEELAFRLAGAALTLAAGAGRAARPPSRRDERRVTAALRRIEAAPDEATSLADLAAEAAMSPYHFLRTFRRLAGMTPHRYVLHSRMHRAAVRLRLSDAPVSAIAFEAGFGDLSTFNRRFRRTMGSAPAAYRRREGATPPGCARRC